MAKEYELWAGPADGERGSVSGKVPDKLYRKGGGVAHTEYVVVPYTAKEDVVRFIPAELLRKREAAGDIEG
jgi:hypothetical protein